jgi:hypothetical protein
MKKNKGYESLLDDPIRRQNIRSLSFLRERLQTKARSVAELSRTGKSREKIFGIWEIGLLSNRRAKIFLFAFGDEVLNYGFAVGGFSASRSRNFEPRLSN